MAAGFRPPFLLRIVDQDDNTVTVPGGGALERDLLTEIVKKITKQGVGIFRTEAQVTQAISQGLREVVQELKAETRKAF